MQGKITLNVCKQIINLLHRNLKIVSGMNMIFIRKKCWHGSPQSLMDSDKRPTNVSMFPEGIHHISYACSLCFHISGDGKGKSWRLSVHIFFLNDVNNLQPLRNIF